MDLHVDGDVCAGVLRGCVCWVLKGMCVLGVEGDVCAGC